MGSACVPALLLAALATCANASRDSSVESQRRAMVTDQLAARGIKDSGVLRAMGRVPRELFVPDAWRAFAYDDRPLPIGEDQTISQPYVVALMTELAALKPGARVLEIGTGSGYQAAVLAEMGCSVYTIEIVEPLARSAAERLRRTGYGSVQVRQGDGYRGWPEQAPFDAIVVTAAPPQIPPALKEQLAEGGRLVIPVGALAGELQLVTRDRGKFTTQTIALVAFVPMTGEAQKPR